MLVVACSCLHNSIRIFTFTTSIKNVLLNTEILTGCTNGVRPLTTYIMTKAKSNESSVKNSSTESTKVKKAYVMPKSVKAKIDANLALKESVFTASKICKYCKTEEVKPIINKFLASRKEKHGIDFNINKVDTRLFKKHASEREVKNKDINGRSLFSFWLVLSLIDREIKAMAAEKAKKEPIPLKETKAIKNAA